jgi:diguanylate cyclase (GGDEF)-like protein
MVNKHMNQSSATSLKLLFRRSQIISIVLILCVFSISFFPLSVYLMKSYARQNLNLHADTLSDSLQPALVFNDVKTIQHMINEDTRNYSIRRIYIYDEHNKLVAHSAKLPQMLASVQYFLDDFFLNKPVQSDIFHRTKVGKIVIYGSSEKILQLIFTFLFSIIISLFFMLSALIFITRSTYQKILQAIYPLMHTAQLVSKHKAYNLRFPKNNIEEFQKLNDVFNELLTKIQDSYHYLQHENQQLSILANHDPLTALPNRNFFYQNLLNVFEDERYRNSIALLFIDNNHFKTINDQHGHLAGDAVLIEMTHRLKQNLRQDDLIARLGGDEFAIMLYPIYNSKDVTKVAESLLCTSYTPLSYDGKFIDFSFSVGIALSKHASSPEELITQADQAMYHAKNSATQWSLFRDF